MYRASLVFAADLGTQAPPFKGESNSCVYVGGGGGGREPQATLGALSCSAGQTPNMLYRSPRF